MSKIPKYYIDGLSKIPRLNRRPLNYVMENLKIKKEKNDLWLEFGVFKGKTINYISKFTNDVVYGFDSFEGLPEDWRPGFKKGAFSTGKKIPVVNKNVSLIIGWFKNTLGSFLSEQKEKKISFIHLDADLYSSTKFVLDNLKDMFKDECVIVFDELIKYPGYDGNTGELLAWYEFVTENDVDYKWIGMNGENVAVKITMNKRKIDA